MSRAVNDSDDFDKFAAYAVDYDVRRNHPFARAWNTAWPAHSRNLCQPIDGGDDVFQDPTCGIRIPLRDISVELPQIGYRVRRPDDLPAGFHVGTDSS